MLLARSAAGRYAAKRDRRLALLPWMCCHSCRAALVEKGVAKRERSGRKRMKARNWWSRRDDSDDEEEDESKKQPEDVCHAPALVCFS